MSTIEDKTDRRRRKEGGLHLLWFGVILAHSDQRSVAQCCPKHNHYSPPNSGTGRGDTIPGVGSEVKEIGRMLMLGQEKASVTPLGVLSASITLAVSINS